MAEMARVWRLGCLALMIAGIAWPAAATQEAWSALARPGVTAIMRHALAPGTGDPPGFTLGDCSTQRTLDGRGRAQARKIGREMRARGIDFDRVLTSQWCRCRETARLLDLGPVETFPALNSFFGTRRENGPEQTARLRAYLDELGPEERVMLVTHQVNITALTGEPVASGEVLVLDRSRAREAEVVGEISIRP